MKTSLDRALKYARGLMSASSRNDSANPVVKTTSLTKVWRIYAPEGRDISHDTKMNLRTITNYAQVLGGEAGDVHPKIRADYGDDGYFMAVNREGVLVATREAGQKTKTQGVFEDRESGIFLYVSNKNYREAEGKLVKAFR